MEGWIYCAIPMITEFTYWICAAWVLLFSHIPIFRTSFASLRIFPPRRSISGNGLPTRYGVHVFGSGVLRLRSALTTNPRKCIPSSRKSVTWVFSWDSSSFILYRKYFVNSRFKRRASRCVEVRITQSSAKRKLYFGVTPAHFRRRVSLHLCLHWRCGSI